MTIKFLFSVVLLFVLSAACRPARIKQYEFEIPMTMLFKEQYELGDTIWVNMDIPQVLPDKNGNEFVDLTNFELYLDFSMHRMDTSRIQVSAIDDFEMVVDKGRFDNNSYYERVVAENVNGQKKFRIGFVPKYVGLYKGEFSIPEEFLLPFAEAYGPGLEISDIDYKEFFSPTTKIPVNAGYENAHLIAKKCLVYSDGTSWCQPSYDELQRRSGFAVRIVR